MKKQKKSTLNNQIIEIKYKTIDKTYSKIQNNSKIKINKKINKKK